MLLAAASTQKGIGVAIIALVLLALLIYIVVENRVSTQSNLDSFLNAPNRKQAPDDEVFEGPRLDRFLSWALVLMTVVAISLPVYWLGEVGRQSGAIRGFDKRSVHRGEEAYFNSPNTREGTPALNCAKCHGPNAGGGAVEWAVKDIDPKTSKPMQENGKDAIRKVNWAAPRINDVALRYKKGQLKSVLTYGRAPVMPAWGILGGGPVTDQTINDLIAYLRHLALEENEEARKVYNTEWDKSHDQDKAYDAAINSESVRKARQKETAEALASAKKLTDSAGKSDGQLLFEMNCARCHVTGWSQGEPEDYASGAFGPSLNKDSLSYRFPDPADQAAFIKNGTEDANKPYGTRGINGWESGGMPYFQNLLTDDMINEIVKYERQLEPPSAATAAAAADTTNAQKAKKK